MRGQYFYDPSERNALHTTRCQLFTASFYLGLSCDKNVALPSRSLPQGAVENLLKPENKDKLVAVLTFHVVPGKIMSTDIAGQSAEVESVLASALSADAADGVRVDDANVVAADIETYNGVIHAIKHVVIPPQTVLLAGRPPGLFP